MGPTTTSTFLTVKIVYAKIKLKVRPKSPTYNIHHIQTVLLYFFLAPLQANSAVDTFCILPVNSAIYALRYFSSSFFLFFFSFCFFYFVKCVFSFFFLILFHRV